jgi:hypothetical protein
MSVEWLPFLGRDLRAAVQAKWETKMGDIMRQTFVLATAMATAALCSLAISAVPALGFEFEFDSETSSSSVTTSSTALVIQLGTSGSVECSSIKLKASPVLGVSATLKARIEEPSVTCIYNDNAKLVSEQIEKFEPKCPIFLESEKLEELSATDFNEGLAELNCTLKIKTKGCNLTVGPTSPSREYEWGDTDLTLGHYESLLTLELKKVKYTISSGCGSSGTSGEFNVSIPIEHVIIPPVM